jgi:hypothetical protein
MFPLPLVIAYYAIVAAAVAYQVVQAKKMRKAAKEAAEARKGFELVVEGEMKPIPLAYGRVKIGGVRVWHATSSNYYQAASLNSNRGFVSGELTSTQLGNTNRFLFFQQVLCHGPIHACYDMVVEESKWINDYALDSSLNYDQPPDQRAAFRTEVMFGQQSGPGVLAPQANSTAVANFSSRATAKFPGMAYATTVIRLNREDPQFSMVPQVQYLIEGRRVRFVVEYAAQVDGAQWDRLKQKWYKLSDTRVYSNNPALCLLDYLTASELSYDNGTDTVRAFDPGKRCSVAEINLSSFYDAARVCGQIVRQNVLTVGKIYRNTDGTRNVESRDLPLYECNMVVDPSKPMRENVEAMLTTMGDARLVWSQGRYKLSVKYPLLEKVPVVYPDGEDETTPPGGGGGAGTDVTPPDRTVEYPGGAYSLVYPYSDPSHWWHVAIRFQADGSFQVQKALNWDASDLATVSSGSWLSGAAEAGVGNGYQVKFELIEEWYDNFSNALQLPSFWSSSNAVGTWYTLSTERIFSMWLSNTPAPPSGYNYVFNFNIYLKHVATNTIYAPSQVSVLVNYNGV